MVPNSVLNQLLGAFFAGAVGYATSLLIERRRAKQEQNDWYTRLLHLVRRLNTEAKSETCTDTTDFEDQTDNLAYKHTAERVLDEMESHFASTPVSVPSHIWETQDKLAEGYAQLSARPPHDDEFVTAIEEMTDNAQVVEKWVKQQSNEID